MKYIKHYYINDVTGGYMTTTNDAPAKRHPITEIPGLEVKIWLQDVNNIDVCLSQVPDSTSVSTITEDGKNSVQVLTEAEYNSVETPYFEAQTLSGESMQARMENDEVLSAEKESAASVKLQEAITALHAL